MFAAGVNAATWYWTGEGGDLNWFTAANWSDGDGNAATGLASGDSFMFDAVTPSGSVNYNPSGDFNIETVTFGAGLTSAVKIAGGKIASLGSAVNNNASYEMEFANEVAFASTINLTTPTKHIIMSGGATLEINPGKKLGAGAVSVEPGATLSIPSSGVVDFSGNETTFESGARLAFCFTDSDSAPVIDFKTTTTIPAGTKIAVFAAGNAFPRTRGGRWAIAKNVSCESLPTFDGNVPAWVVEDAPFAVEGASLYLNVKTLGFGLVVK